MEVYECHLGGHYFEDEIIDLDDLYCEQCGDSDWHLGHADTWEEVISMIDVSCYAPDYIKDLKDMWDAIMENK